MAPSRIVWRTIKGMLPYKTPRGAACLGRLKCYDGCPMAVNATKKMVIPDALKVVKLAPRAKFAVLGNVAKECGWTKQSLIDRLEARRTAKNHEWYKNKVEQAKKENDTLAKSNSLNDVNKQLAEFGY
jgi:large subunit ribosomal protein L13Ae